MTRSSDYLTPGSYDGDIIFALLCVFVVLFAVPAVAAVAMEWVERARQLQAICGGCDA